MVAGILVALSSAIILTLGVMHLVITFRGTKLHPRDPALQARMREVSPMITRETTMWKTWIGFNASHALGIILFGLVYGYLAVVHPAFLFQSRFLLVVGFALLVSYAILGRMYFFSVPFRGVVVALLCYVAGVVAALTLRNPTY